MNTRFQTAKGKTGKGFLPGWALAGGGLLGLMAFAAGAARAGVYRLPTDAEWELAARGGTQRQGYAYSGGNDLNAVGWYSDNSGGAACNYASGRGTWPVGQKTANDLGIHDMSGNVWEWCFDWHPSYVGSFRVLRGGGWRGNVGICRVGDRTRSRPPHAGDYVGFRAVLPGQ